MDVALLLPDEFEVECQIRKIEGDPLHRLASLQIEVSNEEKNPVLKPFRAHAAARSSPQRELQKCALKIKQHREWLVEIKPENKIEADKLRVVEVRLLHIKGRLERLLSSTKSYKLQCREHITLVDLLLTGVQTIMQGNDNLDDTLAKIKEAQQEEPDDLSTSEDEESATEMQKTRVSTLTDKQNNSMPNPILSSTNVNHEPQQPTGRNYMSEQKHFTNLLSKWNIVFDGDSQKLPVERFLFRVEHLAETYEMPKNKLVNQLGLLMTGAAANWFWCHIERNPNIKWDQLRNDLLERFQDRRTDYDVRRAMESRKQRPSEPFRVFYNEILALSLQFRNIPPDTEILHIMRRNMRSGLQVVLADQEIPSITILVQRCLALEDTWKRTGYEPEKLCVRRSIDEVQMEHINNEYYPDNQIDNIDALQTGMLRNKNHPPLLRNEVPGPSDELIICWNCRDIGHRYTDCGKQPNIFCFGCGRANILKPNCFRCSGNSNTRFRNVGNSMPPRTPLPGTSSTNQ